jgi:hypothetical protein
VFCRNYNDDGNPVKLKARLCAQGNAQVKGINFNETYAPTGRSAALRTALTVGLRNGMDIHQMDVKNTILNGVLDEEIYLRAHPAVAVPPGHCLCLKKLIYGLKQAPRVWYRNLAAFFLSIGFNPSLADFCLFIYAVPNWPCYVHVYIEKYAMEDLGQASSLLGMKLTHLEVCITLSQRSYAKKLVREFNLADGHTVLTLMVPGTHLSASTKAEREEFLSLNVNYCHAVGSVNYLAVAT